MSNSPLQPRYVIGLPSLRAQRCDVVLNLADHGRVRAGKVITAFGFGGKGRPGLTLGEARNAVFRKVSQAGSAQNGEETF